MSSIDKSKLFRDLGGNHSRAFAGSRTLVAEQIPRTASEELAKLCKQPCIINKLRSENPSNESRTRVGRELMQQSLPISSALLSALLIFENAAADLPIG